MFLLEKALKLVRLLSGLCPGPHHPILQRRCFVAGRHFLHVAS